jgi:Fic family protein
LAEDRHTVAETASLLKDPDEIARREAENGIRQFDLALDIIRQFVKERERPFRLRSSMILNLHRAALDGLYALAGTWRNTSVKIEGSIHQPPESPFVSEEIEHLCDYVNDHWSSNAVHLAAYVLWKLNWIHPFADGNGRTARAVAYVVLSIKLDSLLPGAPTIPEQIAGNKKPYYEALEIADQHLADSKKIDVSELEKMLASMLSTQLLSAAKEAAGEITKPDGQQILH